MRVEKGEHKPQLPKEKPPGKLKGREVQVFHNGNTCLEFSVCLVGTIVTIAVLIFSAVSAENS